MHLDTLLRPDLTETCMYTSQEGEPEEERRNWASIIISLSLIFFVLLMITIATLLKGPQDPPFFGRRLVMSDLFDVTLRPKPMPYQWLQGKQWPADCTFNSWTFWETL